MKRLYYLSPSIDSTEQVSKDLHEKGISDWNFHVISKDEAGLYSHHLHSASLLHKTDVVRFVERGLLAGGLLGLCFLIPLVYLEEFTFNVWLAITVFCVLFATWAGFVGGISQENYKIQRFHDQIQAGQHLIMIDVNKTDEDLVRSIMYVRHTEATLQGESSTITNPFASDMFDSKAVKS